MKKESHTCACGRRWRGIDKESTRANHYEPKIFSSCDLDDVADAAHHRAALLAGVESSSRKHGYALQRARPTQRLDDSRDVACLPAWADDDPAGGGDADPGTAPPAGRNFMGRV